jgi:hypothetical protein
VSRRFLIPAAIAALSVGAAAQEMAPTLADQALRDQMQTFEAVLQKAVQHGAQAFARQEKDLPPGIELTSDDPYARGFAPPEGGGLFFYVVVPQIRASVNLFLGPQFRRGPGADRQAGPEPTARSMSQSVGAAGVPKDDPMTVSPVVDDGRCAVRARPSRGYVTPDHSYAVAVCDALMDAMLESSAPLSVKSDEWLTVMAFDGGPAQGLVNSPYSYTTYLQIKGSDLQLFRQGKLTKEEARKLVVLKQR